MTAEHITGHSIALGAAIQSTQKIVLGRLVRIGDFDLGTLGESYYDNARLEVIRWLKVGQPEDIRLASLEFAYTIQVLPASAAEHPPVVGQTYLFFMKVRTDSTLRAIKILSEDDPDVGKAEKALGGKAQ